MKKILVVDDEPSFRSLCRRWLERAGHQVVEASHPSEVVGAINGCDVIVLDYCLGSADAEDVLALLDAEDSAIPVILVSGEKPSDAEVRRLETMGIVKYIEKPFHMEDLQASIEKALKISDDLDKCGVLCSQMEILARTGVLSGYEREIA